MHHDSCGMSLLLSLFLIFFYSLKVLYPFPQVRVEFCKGFITGSRGWCVSHSLPYWSRAIHVSLTWLSTANLVVNSREISVTFVVTLMYVFQIRGPPACSDRPSGGKHTATERSTTIFWSTQRPGVFHSWPERWVLSCAFICLFLEIQSGFISSLCLWRKHLHRHRRREAVENQQWIPNFHHSDGPWHPWMW